MHCVLLAPQEDTGPRDSWAGLHPTTVRVYSARSAIQEVQGGRLPWYSQYEKRLLFENVGT